MALLRRKSANPEGRMSLGDHFREFRNRLLISAAAIVACSVIGWIVYDPVTVAGYRFEGVWKFLVGPLQDFADANPGAQVSVNFDQATQAFSMRLKLSMWVGLILASPIWLWQIWAFLVPGLTKREKKVARLFIGSAVPLFLGGCLLGSFGIRNVLDVLYSLTPESASNIVNASNYISFVTKFILVFGLAFLLPVALMALNTIRILPGRVMLKGWRIAIMGIAVFSAMMSPTPDAMSMLVLMVPMIGLYYGACALAVVLDRGRARRSKAEWVDVPDDQASPL